MGTLGGLLLCSSSGTWWASLSIVQLLLLACGEGEARVMAPCVMTQQYRLASMVAWHFPPQSPPSHPLDPSLSSQQQPSPWNCSTIPKLQLPAMAPSKGLISLSGVCMAVARTVWFLFHSGCHKSTISLSALNVSPLTQTGGPDVGIRPLLQFPHPPRAGPVLVTLLFSPLVPSSYRVLCGCIYFLH